MDAIYPRMKSSSAIDDVASDAIGTDTRNAAILKADATAGEILLHEILPLVPGSISGKESFSVGAVGGLRALRRATTRRTERMTVKKARMLPRRIQRFLTDSLSWKPLKALSAAVGVKARATKGEERESCIFMK